MENRREKEKRKDVSGMFKELYSIVTLLRSPSGCPWDRKQTTASLRKNLIEEAYECINAIDASDDENLLEELGDLLLVISMIVIIKEEAKTFTYKKVLQEICNKLIRRHPHVFGDATVNSADDVVVNWERIKQDVEGKRTVHSLLEKIPGSFPPLEKAVAIQKKVSKVGFDWKEVDPVWKKLDEETSELKHAIQENNAEDIEEELGDILFTIVNIGRILKINPAVALNRTNKKFTRRFMELECRLKEKNIRLEDAGLTLLDNIWDEIKKNEKEKH